MGDAEATRSVDIDGVTALNDDAAAGRDPVPQGSDLGRESGLAWWQPQVVAGACRACATRVSGGAGGACVLRWGRGRVTAVSGTGRGRSARERRPPGGWGPGDKTAMIHVGRRGSHVASAPGGGSRRAVPPATWAHTRGRRPPPPSDSPAAVHTRLPGLGAPLTAAPTCYGGPGEVPGGLRGARCHPTRKTFGQCLCCDAAAWAAGGPERSRPRPPAPACRTPARICPGRALPSGGLAASAVSPEPADGEGQTGPPHRQGHAVGGAQGPGDGTRLAWCSPLPAPLGSTGSLPTSPGPPRPPFI